MALDEDQRHEDTLQPLIEQLLLSGVRFLVLDGLGESALKRANVWVAACISDKVLALQVAATSLSTLPTR